MKKELRRTKATYLALIPGLGHLYLRAYGAFIMFLLGYGIIVLLSYYFITTKQHVVTALMTALFLFFYMIFLSSLDVDYQSTKRGLPYTNDLDVVSKSYLKYYIISFVIFAGAVAALVIGESLTNEFTTDILIEYGLLISFILIGFFLIFKFRNPKPGEFPVCKVQHDAQSAEEAKKMGDAAVIIRAVGAAILVGGVIISAVVFNFIDTNKYQDTLPEIQNRTESIQYMIPVGTEEDLKNMQYDGSYILTNDIVLSPSWKPVDTEKPFCGSINGNNHRINGMLVQDENKNFPGLLALGGDGCFIYNLTLDISNAEGGAFIANVSEKSHIIFYNCLLNGDKIDLIVKNSRNSRQNADELMAGYEPVGGKAILGERNQVGYFIEGCIDEKKIKVTLVECDVKTNGHVEQSFY